MISFISYRWKVNPVILQYLVLLSLCSSTISAQEKDASLTADSAIFKMEKYEGQTSTDSIQTSDSAGVNHYKSQLLFIEETLNKCIAMYSTVRDYTCVFHKTERIEDTLIEEKDIIYKFMKPLSVYLRWPSGSEAIYVEGKYDNDLKFHSGNIFGFIVFSLDPRGNLAMTDNRHSILESHIGYIIHLVEQNYNRAKSNNELKSFFEGNEVINGKETLLIKVVFPANKNYYGHIIYFNVDSALYLPEKIVVYGWDMELLEMYHFSNIHINVGLTESDFDIDNPSYDF